MKSIELNQFPEIMKKEQISEQEGVQQLAEYISTNYYIFGLSIYDEDFREEILLQFLEKGTVVFQKFNPALGDFFTYLYSYITNLASSVKKKNAKEKLENDITELELKRSYHDSYENANNHNSFFSDIHIPYSSKKLTAQELKEGLFFPEDSKIEKAVLSLALKSSYYLTDDHIKKISAITGLSIEYLTKLFDYFNKDLERKAEKRKKLEGYRNKAYYYHRKYEKQIQIIQDNLKLDLDSTQNYISKARLEKLQHINKKQINNWERLNTRFQKGIGNIKPSNLSIANFLGICERQVSYYIYCARSGKLDFSELTKQLEEMDKD